MENNSDRMGFALIALSVVAFVLLAANGPLKSTVNGFFDGFNMWQTQTRSNVTYNFPAKNLLRDPYLNNVDSSTYFSNGSISKKITDGDVFNSRPSVVKNVYDVTNVSGIAYTAINGNDTLSSDLKNKTLTVSGWFYVPDEYMPYFEVGYYDANNTNNNWANGGRVKGSVIDTHGNWKYISGTFTTNNVKQSNVIIVIGLTGLPSSYNNVAHYYVGAVKLEEGSKATVLS